MSRLSHFGLVFLLVCPGLLPAQVDAERGLPMITNYGPRDYNAHSINWAVAQDNRGVMYFGNQWGVLQFDGAEWRLLSLPNRSTIRSLGVTDSGRVFVGGVGEIGYLEADSVGQLQYVSLLPELPPLDRPITDIWHTFVYEDEVVFATDAYVIRWSPDTVRVIEAGNAFHVAFQVDDEFYIREWERGLLKLVGDSLLLVPGGEQFDQERVYVMLPYDETRALLVTRTMGLFLFDGERFTPWRTEVDAFFRENLIYLPGTRLRNGNYVLASISGGFVVIDREGKLIYEINKQTGLRDNSVLFTFEDALGDLWVGQTDGISRVELGSPFTIFDGRSGIEASLTGVHRFDGELFATTQAGALKFNPRTRQWQPIAVPSNQMFSMETFRDRLLIAAGLLGFYEYRNGRTRLVRGTVDNTFSIGAFRSSEYDSTRVFLGTLGDGMWSMKLTPAGEWIFEGGIGGVTDNFLWIEETGPGEIWFAGNGPALSVSYTTEGGLLQWDTADTTHYGDEKGFSDEGNVVFSYGPHLFGISWNRTGRFDAEADTLVPDPILARHTEQRGPIITADGTDDRLWITTGDGVFRMGLSESDTLVMEPTPLTWLVDHQISDLYVDDDGIVWAATGDGIVRYDPELAADPVGPTALIRSLAVDGDSLVYGGEIGNNVDGLRLPFRYNNVRFGYASPSYRYDGGNEFQVRLEGLTSEWSDWSSDTRTTYNNLGPGSYTFFVKTRDPRGVTSEVTTMHFTILPPWYRTWLAYGVYALLLGMAGFGVDRFQRRRLVKQEREKSRLREVELRAQAAESEAKALHAENEQKRNVEILSDMGRSITATLSIADIIDTVYENVNTLMDASVFTIGLYNKEKNRLDFPATREKGESLEPYHIDLDDANRLAVACFEEEKEVVINDWATQYVDYVEKRTAPVAGEDPSSIIYLPLQTKDRTIGVISAQSFEKDAYTEYHLNILRNLATYTAIALDNAEAYSRLNATIEDLNRAMQDLETTQEQLITQEKMASLGQLTAGIAHEIKNPLNFVNNFAELNAELASEIADLFEEHRGKMPKELMTEFLPMLTGLTVNANQIHKHGKRADSIIRNMMQHASGGQTERYPVGVNAFVEEYVSLSYHGMRAQVPSLNATIERDFDKNAGNLKMAPQEMGRVILNLVNNALYAVHERSKTTGGGYEPTVRIATRKENGQVYIKVSDNGTGIPAEIREKIFEPLFTTKPAGSGTGLGLSLSFDIITNGHGGNLRVDSEEGEGSTFTVTLPTT